MIEFDSDKAKVINILLGKQIRFPTTAQDRKTLYSELTKDHAMDFGLFEMTIAALGMVAEPATMKELFQSVEQKDGSVSEPEFSFLIQVLSFRILVAQDHFSCADLFGLFDFLDTGTITKAEFNRFFEANSSANMSQDQLKSLFDKIDTSNSGNISFEEFVVGMISQRLYRVLNFRGEQIHLSRREFQILYCRSSGSDIYEANAKFSEMDLEENGFLDCDEMEQYIEALEERSDWKEYLFTGDALLICLIIIFVIALGKETIAEPNIVDLMEVLIGIMEIYFFGSIATEEYRDHRENITILRRITKALKESVTITVA